MLRTAAEINFSIIKTKHFIVLHFNLRAAYEKELYLLYCYYLSHLHEEGHMIHIIPYILEASFIPPKFEEVYRSAHEAVQKSYAIEKAIANVSYLVSLPK